MTIEEKRDLDHVDIIVANGVVLFPVYFPGKMCSEKQRTQLSIFLSEGIHRGGTETGAGG